MLLRHLKPREFVVVVRQRKDRVASATTSATTIYAIAVAPLKGVDIVTAMADALKTPVVVVMGVMGVFVMPAHKQSTRER